MAYTVTTFSHPATIRKIDAGMRKCLTAPGNVDYVENSKGEPFLRVGYPVLGGGFRFFAPCGKDVTSQVLQALRKSVA